MPKAERGTVKDIANRMKARGLQKLKWYCQMCQKQCRDENGFKCHTQSDSHLRQMKLFASNAGGMLDDFSSQFSKMYMETLRRRHGTSRVNANNVYQEVIQDKDHIHMNATKWVSLTEFVQYLGKQGLVVVDETERGWYVTYIERDATKLARQEAQKRRVEADRQEEANFQAKMELQRVEAAKAYERAMGGGEGNILEATKATNIGDRTPNESIKISLGGPIISTGNTSSSSNPKKNRKAPLKSVLLEEDDEDDDDQEEDKSKTISTALHNPKSRWSTSQKPQQQQQHTDTTTTAGNHHSETTKRSIRDSQHVDHPKTKKLKKHNKEDDNIRKDYWLYRDIIVRIISKKLAKGKYYKCKAVVDKVLPHNKYTARVQVLDNHHNHNKSSDDDTNNDDGVLLELDQDDLETVIPKKDNEKVRILNGPGRHEKATIVSMDKKKYVATLQLQKDGRIVEHVDFADFSKIW